MKYQAKCCKCGESFMWDSECGQTEKMCSECMAEDASTNSLGAMPTGRLLKKQPAAVKHMENNSEVKMSLASKMLKELFEEEQPAAMEPEAPAAPAEGEPEDQPKEDLNVVCADICAAVAELKDEDEKAKFMALCDRLKVLCPPPAEPEGEEGDVSPEAPAEGY